MLARRFAIICLVIMLFGMWFSALVANADRRLPTYRTHAACILSDTPACRALR